MTFPICEDAPLFRPCGPVRRAAPLGALAALTALLTASPPPAQTEWMPARMLEGRCSHALVYDASRKRVVLFGGSHWFSGGTRNDTWERDGTSWQQRSPTTSPPARGGHAMAYDVSRQRVVLFGGHDGAYFPNRFADTWEWDGTDWRQRNPSTSPSARAFHAMAYDVARQVVVLFGGFGSASHLGDTWEWDGTDWQQRSPAGSPPARGGHTLAYDMARQRVVLFGGNVNGGGADTWEWDGTNWQQRSPVTSPPGRWRPAMAYDVARQRLVLFGGSGATMFPVAETWEWDGADWQQRSPAASPPERGGFAMAYDMARQRVVLFGGYNVFGDLPDTWEWDGASWQQRSPAASPPTRRGHAMAYDMARQVVVLFGGYSFGGFGGYNLGDTWEWDGTNWQQRSPTTSPPARGGHAMAYDMARQRVVLFGGETGQRNLLADTWEWDGTDWQQRSLAVGPPTRGSHAMAYDIARQRVVLFGGSGSADYLGDTWEWDGAIWQQRRPATSPPVSAGHAMAYDIARQRVVLCGGGGARYLTETWEWDGLDWQRITPTTGSPVRINHALAYDVSRQRVVLFGGDPSQSLGPSGDTLEWDGTDWQQRRPATGPPAQGGHAMAYDMARQRVVLLGAGDRNNFFPSMSFLHLADTWLYGDLVPAGALTIGSPCTGTNGPPLITSSIPFLGNPGLVLDLISARASTPCLFGLSPRTQNLQLGGGCALYLANPIVLLVTTTNASGFASTRLAVPPDLALRGAAVYAQGVAADPMGGFGGLSFSAGLRLVLGD